MPRPAAVPRAGRRERRRAETRERLFRAALALFAARGWAAVTVEDITEAADVGKGTFFNYFPSKEHVFAAFGRMQVSKIRAALERARNGAPVARVLRELPVELAAEPGRSRALVRAILVAVHSSDAVRRLMGQQLLAGREALAGLLALGQRQGVVRAGRPPRQMARAMQQMAFGTLMLWSLDDSADPAPHWIRQAMELLFEGLAPRSGAARRGKNKEKPS